jgi:hypothetical protein
MMRMKRRRCGKLKLVVVILQPNRLFRNDRESVGKMVPFPRSADSSHMKMSSVRLSVNGKQCYSAIDDRQGFDNSEGRDSLPVGSPRGLLT